MTGAVVDALVADLARSAAASSPVWAAAVAADVDGPAVFGPLSGPAFAEGVEAIYEGYLVHHAPRGRAFAPADREQGLLLGDYLYATGLVRICAVGDVEAIAALADLVSLAAHLRAEGGRPVDAELWLATARHLAGPRDEGLAIARDAVRRGDPAPLLALVDDADAAAPLDAHRRLMGDTP